MSYSVGLKMVLAMIASSETPGELREAGEAARRLPENERDIARWSYEYHFHQGRSAHAPQPIQG